MEYKLLKHRCRNLLKGGNTGTCIEILQNALAKTPDDERLQTKLRLVKQVLDQGWASASDIFSEDEEDGTASEHDVRGVLHERDSGLDLSKRTDDSDAEPPVDEQLSENADSESDAETSDDEVNVSADEEEEPEDDSSEDEITVNRDVNEAKAEHTVEAEGHNVIFPGFKLNKRIDHHLYAHQREGLQWMFSLFKHNKGGILCDETGLGKTLQVIAYLQGMMDVKKISSALIVIPPAVVRHWKDEFKRWASPRLRVLDYHSSSKKEQESALQEAMSSHGVILLTTYGLLSSRLDKFCLNRDDEEFTWDYVILDEAQYIKNHLSSRHESVSKLSAKHHLILTQTDVRQNLSELWSYLDVVQPALLGEHKDFKRKMETPITRGLSSIATSDQRQLALKLRGHLDMEVFQPHVLCRTKAQVSGKADGPNLQVNKQEMVLWTLLSKSQQATYIKFLASDRAKQAQMGSGSQLIQINALKSICDHPQLLSKEWNEPKKDTKKSVSVGKARMKKEDTSDDETETVDLEHSGKSRLVIKLIQDLLDRGHRIVVFASSRRVLSILEETLRDAHISSDLIDGSRTHDARMKVVDKFQEGGRRRVLLLTKRTALGLTLTAADRVIIYDPSWNGSADVKAIDTVYRVQQQNDVQVYHLITCGTVEEKIYLNNIAKKSVTYGTGARARRFNNTELWELFEFDSAHESKAPEKVKQLTGKEPPADALTQLKPFIDSGLISGVSYHDPSLFTELPEGEKIVRET